MGSRLRVLGEPLDGNINIVLILARDRVAAHLPVLEVLEVEPVDELRGRQRPRKVVLVSQDKERDPAHGGLAEKVVKLGLCNLYILVVGRVHHVDNAVHSSAVPLPHAPEARLPVQIPQFYRDSTLCHLPHVESNSWNHIFVETSGGNDVDQGSLPRVLQSDQGQLHLLLEEEASQPVKQNLEEAHGVFPFASLRVAPRRSLRLPYLVETPHQKNIPH